MGNVRESQGPAEHDHAPVEAGASRRAIVKGAAWSVPVIAAAVSSPLAAATVTDYTIQSAFGIGWYPTTVNQTGSGVLQFDSAHNDKYFYVEGTQAGDVLSDIHLEVRISTAWPVVSFSPVSGSNPLWSTLAYTGVNEVVDGVTYRVYRTDYLGTVTATGATTHIPIGFYFRASTPYYSGALARTWRYVTVNSTDLTLQRAAANINNTNVTTPPAP